MSDPRFRHLVSLLVALTLPAASLAAEPLWRTIRPAGFVTDAATVLSAQDRSALEADLEQFRRETTNEISVVILPSLEESPSEEVAREIGRRWGVGTAKNNGIVLLVALQEREIRLEVGYGLEGVVPDAVAKRIIDEVMVPKFQERQFGPGIQAGVEVLKKATAGEYKPREQTPRPPSGESYMLMGLSVLLVLRFLFIRSRSWWLGGIVGGVLGMIGALLGGMWWFIPAMIFFGFFFDFIFSKLGIMRGGRYTRMGAVRGGRGRDSRGGFGGFGGGSFGGGGAGGKW